MEPFNPHRLNDVIGKVLIYGNENYRHYDRRQKEHKAEYHRAGHLLEDVVREKQSERNAYAKRDQIRFYRYFNRVQKFRTVAGKRKPCRKILQRPGKIPHPDGSYVLKRHQKRVEVYDNVKYNEL